MGVKSDQKKKKRNSRNKRLVMKSCILVVLLVILGGAIWLLADQMKRNNQTQEQAQANPTPETENPVTQEPEKDAEEVSTEKGQVNKGDKEEIIAKADLLAAQYDYDAAIEALTEAPNADTDNDIQSKKAEYEETKASCVPVNASEVTHIFYHSLVVDPDKCFGNTDDPLTAGFNQWMTTVDEFNRITQEMYDKGYVMVHLRDLVDESVDADGTVHFTPAEVLLPPGKKAFVMSLDDLSYYHSYDNRGIASKLILDENGEVRNEYINDDGSITTGDFDVVPLMNEFVKEHPDASYRGAKGTIALTGYNGILGYRTDGAYESRDAEGQSADQKVWLDKNPNFDYQKDCEDAKKVADVIKEEGWEFASHTWGHRHIAQIPMEDLQADTQKWATYVEPLVGKADTIIFAHGEDLGDWRDYNLEDAKLQYLKQEGYNFFCNVDSAQYFLQIRDSYVRQGRRNLDGFRLYKDKVATSDEDKKTKDLFDAAAIYDVRRPDVPDL